MVTITCPRLLANTASVTLLVASAVSSPSFSGKWDITTTRALYTFVPPSRTGKRCIALEKRCIVVSQWC